MQPCRLHEEQWAQTRVVRCLPAPSQLPPIGGGGTAAERLIVAKEGAVPSNGRRVGQGLVRPINTGANQRVGPIWGGRPVSLSRGGGWPVSHN
jgi:hypothetical protein